MSCHYLALIQSQYLSLDRKELDLGNSMHDFSHMHSAVVVASCSWVVLFSHGTVTSIDTKNVAV